MDTGTVFRAIDNLLPPAREALLGRIAQMLVEALAQGQRPASGRGRGRQANGSEGQTPRAAATEEDVLAYIRANPDQRTEQIAAALGSDVKVAIRKLRNGKFVRSKGQRRAMTYSASASKG